MDWSVWLAFFAAAWVISISPGTGAVFAMSSGLTYGFKRGYVGTIGMILGMWTLLAVAALGLGALLTSSTIAFSIVKALGVGYLIWLGILQWRSKAEAIKASATSEAFDAWQMIVKGWAVNATNPKGVLFMLAVMPQFIQPNKELVPQYLIIAVTLSFTDLVVMAGYTFFAAKVLRLLQTEQQIRLLNRIFGSFFIGAALLLATFKRGQ